MTSQKFLFSSHSLSKILVALLPLTFDIADLNLRNTVYGQIVFFQTDYSMMKSNLKNVITSTLPKSVTKIMSQNFSFWPLSIKISILSQWICGSNGLIGHTTIVE